MTISTRLVNWPEFVTSDEQPEIQQKDFAERCSKAYARASSDWLIVYADREHYGNMTFLTGFEPRFEEALLLLGPSDARILVVGNEGLIYAAIAGLQLDVVLCQTLSLMGQPRAKAPRLADVLREAGISPGQSTAVAGWKYLEVEEVSDVTRPAFVPAFMVETINSVTGRTAVDATKVLMHPVEGLRSTVSAEQIAAWEYSAVQAASSVFEVIEATRPGVTEYDAVQGMNYRGHPLSAHVMFASGKGVLNGLRSPSAKTIERDDAVTTAIGFWGGLTCRAGVVSTSNDDFLAQTVFPYFGAITAWYSAIGVGVTGGHVWDVVMEALADVEFGSLVNPGHLIGHEEWTNTPFRDGSSDVLRSGMAIQSDIIPSPLPEGHAINAEDTVVLMDRGLRHELAGSFPDLWRRIQGRREYMRDELGIPIGDDVLPLSPTCGYLPPLWESPTLACVID